MLRHARSKAAASTCAPLAALLPPGERAALDRALLGLAQKQLVRPDRPDFAGEDAFRFTHALIRDAAYAGMPKRLRGELHERLADWLARQAAVARRDRRIPSRAGLAPARASSARRTSTTARSPARPPTGSPPRGTPSSGAAMPRRPGSCSSGP